MDTIGDPNQREWSEKARAAEVTSDPGGYVGQRSHHMAAAHRGQCEIRDLPPSLIPTWGLWAPGQG